MGGDNVLKAAVAATAASAAALSCKLMTAFSSEARKGCRQPERASLFVLHFLILRNFVMCRLNFCAEFATYFSLASSASSASSCFFVHRAQKFCVVFSQILVQIACA